MPVVQLLEARRYRTEWDRRILEWSGIYQISIVFTLVKMDKVNRQETVRA